MKSMRILGVFLFVAMLAGLVLGSACARAKGEDGQAGVGIESIANNGNGTFTLKMTDGSSYTTDDLTGPSGGQGQAGVGIQSVVNNGNGTFTLNMTDGSSFTTPNLTGPRGDKGDKGDKGDPGILGAQMATWNVERGIYMDWDSDEAVFVITPDNLPRLLGWDFSPNKAAQIYLVVAPASSVLVATVTTNSLGCFYAELDELNEAGDDILVEPDASLDRVSHDGDGFRECYFQAKVDGQQVAMCPIILWGNQDTIVEAANAELVTLQAAIESCLADANSGHFDAGVVGWDGSVRGTGPVIDDPVGGTVEYAVYDQIRTHQLRAAYDISVTGDITNGDPTITGGWGSEIRWNATDVVWEETP